MLLALLLAAAPYPLDGRLPGVETPSSAWVRAAVKAWTPAKPPAALTLQCWTVPGAPSVIAVRQTMPIAAPIEQVAAIVEDFAHYVDLYPDLAATERVKGSDDQNRFVLFTEQQIPVFPNVKVFNTWQVDRPAPGRVVYRYQLKEKTTGLNGNDGFVVLESTGPASTAFTEVDFIDTDPGPIPESTVWRLTLEGIYRSDLALKLKAEHPGWSYAQIQQAREKDPPAGCYEGRKPRP